MLLSASLTAMAQNTQSRIVDLDGNGVAGVEIIDKAQCFPSFGPIATGTTSTFTNADGSFTWPVQNAPGGGSNCVVTLTHTYTLKKDGYTFTRNSFFYKPVVSVTGLPYNERLPLIQASALPAWDHVSAASFSPSFAAFTTAT